MSTAHAMALFATNLYNIFITILDTIYHFSRKADILQKKANRTLLLAPKLGVEILRDFIKSEMSNPRSELMMPS